VGTIVNDWSADQHEAFNADFYAEAAPVELPEVTWRDAEDFAVESVNAELPAEETKEEQAKRRAAERQHLVNQRHYDALESQLADVETSESLFAVASTMSKAEKAFNLVCSTYFALRNSSMVKVARYNGEGRSVKKAAMPNKQDLFCDCELVGKLALKTSPEMLRSFQKESVENEGEDWAAVHYKTRAAIAQRVGSEYVRCGLYPVSRYFRGKAS
jgi:hypothetical protein